MDAELLRWEAEDKEMMEKRRKEEAAEKKHKEEEEMRRVAMYREEREKKLERARRAKASMEENLDALRESGLVALCNLHYLLVYGLFMNNVVYCWTFYFVVM